VKVRLAGAADEADHSYGGAVGDAELRAALRVPLIMKAARPAIRRRTLIGDNAYSAWQASGGEEVDARSLADPGSILSSGLRPTRTDD